jgi:hypothetical protein
MADQWRPNHSDRKDVFAGYGIARTTANAAGLDPRQMPP